MPVPRLDSRTARRLTRFALAHLMPSAVVDGVRAHDVAAGGDWWVRVYTPDGARSGAGVLWIHGGGLMIGHPSMDDKSCSRLALALSGVVVSVDYRLAPAHPYPAAIDDCLAAWNWLQARASRLGIDPGRVAVAGQSAGGGLAAALVQRLHDLGGPQPAAQALYAPMLDDRTGAEHDRRHWIWTARNCWLGWHAYLAGTSPDAPHAVPARRDDVSGLPPAWIGVGAVDVLRGESVAYAGRLRAAGVGVTVDEVPGAPHGFENWAPESKVATAFLERSRAWLAAALSPA